MSRPILRAFSSSTGMSFVNSVSFSPETRTRELRALTAAAAEHPRAIRRLLVLDRDALALADTSAVDVQPAYEWLLAGPDGGSR